MGLNIPRVTVHADIDEDVSVGEVNTASVGYGLHQAWIYSSMFGTLGLFGVNAPGSASSSISSVYIISILVNFICLVSFGMHDGKIMSLSIRRYPMVVPAACMSVGTLLILLCDASSDHALPFLVLSGVLTGIGSAMYLLFWGIAFARMNLVSIIINTVIAFAVATVVYMLFVILPVPLGGILSASLPFFELLLVRAHAPKPYFERRSVPVFNPLPVNRSRFYLAFGGPMLFFGIALGYLRETSMGEIVIPFWSGGQLAFALWALILAVAVLIVGLGIMREGRVEDYLRPIVPFVAVALVFIPMGLEQDSPFSAVVVLGGYFCFEALLWVMLGGFSQRYRLSPVLVYGIGRGSLALGSFAGIALTSFSERIATALPYTGAGTVVVLALTCIVIGQALLPRERDIRRVVLHGVADKVTIADMLNLKKGDAKLEALDKETGATEEENDVESASCDSHVESDACADERREGTRDSAESEGCDFGNDDLTGDMPSKAEARETGEDELARKPRAALMAMGALKDGESDSERDQKIGYFRRKCEVIANQYLLSARETEVLFYLAKGYNSAYLQEKLFISEGTAKTHIRHIYGKTNVHSQQQLMRLVNEIRI